MLLADVHHSEKILYLGRVCVDPHDAECYNFEKLEFDRTLTERRQWYNDIAVLYQGVGISLKIEFTKEKSSKARTQSIYSILFLDLSENPASLHV